MTHRATRGPRYAQSDEEQDTATTLARNDIVSAFPAEEE